MFSLLVLAVGWLLIQPQEVCGQGFILRSVHYMNGDTVLLSKIGEGENGLFCTTTQTDCCGQTADGLIVPGDRRGEFYYDPDETHGQRVPTRGGAGSDGLFRGRGHQNISLQRLSTATTTPPAGQYRCDIPDRNGTDSHTSMFINIGILVSYFSITSIGNNTAGEEYQLISTVSVQNDVDDTPIFSWFGPPNSGQLPNGASDTRMKSGVMMSSNSTYSNTLQFDPLQSSHEGNYICQVAVGNVVSGTKSIQVNVEEPVISVTISGGTPILGTPYTFTCTVNGADRLNPTVTYMWFKDNNAASDEQVTTQPTFTLPSLKLTDAGQYSCTITVNSAYLNNLKVLRSQSNKLMLETSIFQIRLNNIPDCSQWILIDTGEKSAQVVLTLVEEVENTCECGFNRDQVTNDAIQCFPESPQHVTFRARLTWKSEENSLRVITYIEDWVMNTQFVSIQNVRLGIDSTCTLIIEDLNSPECSTMSTLSSTIIVGAVLGSVLLILLLCAITVVTVIVAVKQYTKGKKEFQSRTEMELPPLPVPTVTSYPYGVSQNESYATCTNQPADSCCYDDMIQVPNNELLNHYEDIGQQYLEGGVDYPLKCPPYTPIMDVDTEKMAIKNVMSKKIKGSDRFKEDDTRCED